MTRHDQQRLTDILASIDAIKAHLTRGEITDGLIFDAIRMRLLEIGEAVKMLTPDLLDTEPDIPWRQVADMRNRLAHRDFDTSHAIVTASVGSDLDELRSAVTRMAVEGQGLSS